MSKRNCVHKTVLILGIFELLFSVALITCGIVNIIFKSHLFFIGHGLWGGAVLALTSIFAITAGKRKSTGLHITHMVFAILCCVLVLPVVKTIFSYETNNDLMQRRFLYDDQCRNCPMYSGYYNNGMYGSFDSGDSTAYVCPDFCYTVNAKSATNEIVALVMCSLLFIILIVSASFTCCAVCSCCGASGTNATVVPNTQDTIVMYNYPMHSQPTAPVQLSPNYPIAFYPSAANAAYIKEQDQSMPPAYSHQSFTASLAESGFQPPPPEVFKPSDL